ncbi:hypothetical protein BDV36DRAFT_250155 [Aspergillus pseudocaelatus]|uniref:DUF676 domain-containing protein n=1 Tax=Aspergillus pseudocaelatus TaxID=1825620 RepID=A0ABQ6WSU6_9EURO|nr:hypothetical protein BDV36DRAFT_250155 [Aspergillus pseudocaelatus]
MSENDVIVGDKGMTVLQDGGDDPELDIIFIHGLQGHPESTWTYTKTTGRLWSKKTQTVFWPKALLAQHDSCKSARIMTYGYNSHAYGFKTKVDFCNIQGLAESLRNAVAAFRTKCQHRPLMFIVHSLGGLLVKEVRDDRKS